jgi:hypothetical protein
MGAEFPDVAKYPWQRRAIRTKDERDEEEAFVT